MYIGGLCFTMEYPRAPGSGNSPTNQCLAIYLATLGEVTPKGTQPSTMRWDLVHFSLLIFAPLDYLERCGILDRFGGFKPFIPSVPC